MSENTDDPTRRQMMRVVDDAEIPAGGNPFIPENYPLVPIGVGPGTIVQFLDSHGQYQQPIARDLSRNNLQKWFSRVPGWLLKNFPRYRKGQNDLDAVETFKPELAADQLIHACAHYGYWEPKGRLCGRGAWRGADDDLVLHLGDKLWIGGRLHAVGRRGDMVYPRGQALMRPAKDAQGWASQDGVGRQVLRLLGRWKWQRPDLDTLLLLGWIGSALLGGALKVRPAAWVTGHHGAGKSYLLQTISGLFDSGRAVVFSTDTTAAAIWQTLGCDALPVILDETERQVDNRKLEALLQSMRAAYSGGQVQRGSSEGVAHQYPVRSSFMFSSINVMPLRSQDRSRCVILEMIPFEPSEMKIPIAFGELPQLGRALLRRMVDEWPRLQNDVMPAYSEALGNAGWTGRGADTMGTLLACASVLVDDEHAVEDDMQRLEAELESLLSMQQAEEAPDWVRCIDHLLGSMVAPWRAGEMRPLGELIRIAAGYGPSPVAEPLQFATVKPDQRSDDDAGRRADQDDDAREAARALSGYGIKVVLLQGEDGEHQSARRMVAIANVSTALQALFRDTHWQGLSGTLGGWRSVLARAPGAEASRAGVRFRGGIHRATFVPLDLFLRLDRDGTAL